MKKKILIILTFIIFTGCEYKPIYSESNKTNYKIVVTDIIGDKKFNKFLVDSILRNSQKDSNEIITIKINSEYTKNILAKNTAGNITDYQSTAVTTFSIEKNQNLKTFTVNEKFNFQKMTDKYEEKNYEENIKKNLATSISQRLILRLSIIE
ncbi:hypothetical protein [Candidatus Pelagibacter sp. HIMB1483]|uniref:hypothetical protein n=1 Tax=Candidatus Pelagibacter sp. HIMB1483 TaxID=3415414 RepID=UPI003F84C194